MIQVCGFHACAPPARQAAAGICVPRRVMSAAKSLSRRCSSAAALPSAGGDAHADPLAQPMVCAGAAAVFALTAFDVLGNTSLHLLAHVDAAAHEFVVSYFPATAEARFAANAVSDVPIATAVAAAAIAGLASGVHAPLRTLRRAALAAAAFFAPGWGLTTKDVPLIDLLKHAFRRARPGYGFEHSSTFSMPSGHTFTACFWVSCAILLASTCAADGSSAGVSKLIRRNQTVLWLLVGVTATGRLLSDVHWLSDTIAGAALAVTTVSLVAVLLDSMETAAGKAGATAASLPPMHEAEGEREENEVFKSTRN